MFLLSSCLASVWSLLCRPSVGSSTGHIIGVIVPANSNLIPSGHSLRPERMLILFPASFFFFNFASFLFLFLPFCPPSLHFACVCIYHGYVPGTISLQLIRDAIPQLVSTVSLRTGTAVHVRLFCFLPSRRFFVACFVTTS